MTIWNISIPPRTGAVNEVVRMQRTTTSRSIMTESIRS